MNTKVKLLLYIIGTVIFTGVVVGVVIIPTVNSIKKINTAITNERLDLERKYLRGQLVRKTIEDLNIIKPNMSKLDTVFIQKGDELRFVSTLEDLATVHGVRQTIKLDNQTEMDKNNVQSLPITLTTEGGFTQTLNYLRSLERLNFYINIDSIQLTAHQESITGTFSGKVFNKEITTP